MEQKGNLEQTKSLKIQMMKRTVSVSQTFLFRQQSPILYRDITQKEINVRSTSL